MLLEDTKDKHELAVVRDTLAARVADRLRDWILVERLKPGAILTERELAELAGVSRTPMREALRILAGEGLVEMVPNRRPRVADPTLEQLLALLDVLAALEALAGEKAALFITPEEIATLEEIIEALAHFPDDGEALAYFRLDMTFHRSIVKASNNPALVKTHQQYNAAVFRARFLSTRWETRRPLMQDQHSSILGALKRKDGAAASAEMREHLMQLKRNITDLYAEKDRKASQAQLAETG
ncbi:MAG: GntR family transcriptional regulator [Rhodospirillales bacterium]